LSTDTREEDFDFKRLLLRTPVEEFSDFARLRIRTAERLGDEELELLLDAVELGRKLLGGTDDDS